MISSRREFMGALASLTIVGSRGSLAGILTNRVAGAGRVTVLPAQPGGDPITRTAQMAIGLGASREIPTIIFIPGTTKEELAAQMLSAQAGVDLRRIRRRRISHEEWKALQVAAESLMKLPVLVDDSSDLTLPQLVRKCHTLKESHGIRRVIIVSLDVSATMAGPDGHSAPDKAIRTLDVLAHDLDISVTLIL